MSQSHSEHTLNQLVEQLKQSAAQLSLDAVQAPVASAVTPHDPLPPVSVSVALIPQQDSYHADQFLWLEGEAFIDAIYQHLLRREVDLPARQQLSHQLANGGSRAQIMLQLWRSAEGQAAGVTLHGLRGLRLLQRLAARPDKASRFLGWAGFGLHRRCQRYLNGPSRQQLQQGLAAQQRAMGQLVSQLAQREVELQARQNSLNDHKLAQLRAEVSYQQRAQELLQQRLQENLTRVALAPQAEQEVGQDPEAGQALASLLAEHGQDKLDAYYIAFENRFRGEQAEISRRMARYLPLIEQAGQNSDEGVSVVDVGCGRGEWLELIRAQGWQGSGVDLNKVMVQECQSKGLVAAEQDVIDYLQTLPEASQTAVTGFHIIEHLPFETLFRLFEESARVLRPGGIILFETPNPENALVGSHLFYHDVTHRNPITPDSIAFLAEYTGFCAREIIRLNPMDSSAKLPGDDALSERLNQHLYGPQDFALLACKA